MLCSKCQKAADTPTKTGQCEEFFAAAEARGLGIIELAQQLHQSEGSVEIDDDAQLSEGADNGCYVQAWVWVDFEGTPFDKENGKEKPHEQPAM